MGLVEGNWGFLYDNTPSKKKKSKKKTNAMGEKNLSECQSDYTIGIWAKIKVLV